MTRPYALFSTTVLLCTIVFPVFFLFLWALIIQEPIEPARNEHFTENFVYHLIAAFSISIIVQVQNLQQTLKQKFCYLYYGRLIKRSHHLPLIITFVCMLGTIPEFIPSLLYIQNPRISHEIKNPSCCFNVLMTPLKM